MPRYLVRTTKLTSVYIDCVLFDILTASPDPIAIQIAIPQFHGTEWNVVCLYTNKEMTNC